MRLKSFTAQTMKEAMQMVREALGEDAIIVANREEKIDGQNYIHLTAAIDNDALDSQPENDGDWMYADDDNEAMVIEELTETMLRHSVPDAVLDEIISCAAVLGHEEPRAALLSSIESIYKFAPLPIGKSKTPLMLVGAPGAGKTLTAAKIAARAAMEGLNIAVITTDTERAGGREQLESLTKLMGVELKIAKSPTMLKALLLESRQADQVIIDTASTNPFDQDAVKLLAQYIGVGEMDTIVTIPAGGDAEESGEIARIFANIGASRIVPTRIDVARRLGSILSAAYEGGLVFADMGATSKVADGLSPVTPKRLTQLLMPRSERAKMDKIQKVG